MAGREGGKTITDVPVQGCLGSAADVEASAALRSLVFYRCRLKRNSFNDRAESGPSYFWRCLYLHMFPSISLGD